MQFFLPFLSFIISMPPAESRKQQFYQKEREITRKFTFFEASRLSLTLSIFQSFILANWVVTTVGNVQQHSQAQCVDIDIANVQEGLLHKDKIASRAVRNLLENESFS